MKKLICILLALCMLAALSACGGDAQNQPAAPTATSEPAPAATEAPAEAPAGPAETLTWGDWSFAVPDGFELKGGDLWDENDPRYFSLKKSDFSYFDFKADDENTIMNSYNYNKQTYTNEQKDVQARLGDIEWVGFQYGDGFGGQGFEAYATVDGTPIRVSSAGFPFDSDTAKEILGSLKHSGTGKAEEEPSADPAAFWARFRGDWHGMLEFRECTGKYEYLDSEEVTAIARFKVFESGAINPFVGVHVEDTPFEHLYAEFVPERDCVLLKGMWINASFEDVEITESNGTLSFTVPISKEAGSLLMVFNLRRLDDTGWTDEDPRLDEETIQHCIGMTFDELAKLNGYSFADYPSEDQG